MSCNDDMGPGISIARVAPVSLLAGVTEGGETQGNLEVPVIHVEEMQNAPNVAETGCTRSKRGSRVRVSGRICVPLAEKHLCFSHMRAGIVKNLATKKLLRGCL